MIFVTVGMHDRGFDRLVRAADEMTSFVEQPILVQRGVTEYQPKSAKSFDFADEAQMQRCLSEARVVVSHGGAGSILSALRASKPLVIAPRLKRFDEVIDDHQLELAQALAGQGKAVTVTELSAEALRQAIMEAMRLITQASSGCDLRAYLRAWLEEQAVQPRVRRRWFPLQWREGG